MTYIAYGDERPLGGALGCGPGCQCAPCRGTHPALSESYVDDEDRPARRSVRAGGVSGFAEAAPALAPGAGATWRPPAPAAAINVLLPGPGTGYYLYGDRNHQYGRADTVRAVQAIGAIWQRRHPNGPPIGMGNISLRGGGPTPAHAAHQLGLEIDIRPMRGDGQPMPTNIEDPSYSAALTQELVDTIHANGVMPVRVILFNDPAVRGVRPYPGHGNHLHVGFLATVSTAAGPVVGGAVSAREVALLRSRVARGERSVNVLTDLVFNARHPERRARPIMAGEVALAAEWNDLRRRLVLPALAQAGASGAGAGGGRGRGRSRRPLQR